MPNIGARGKGRPPGALNKRTLELMELVKKSTPKLVKELERIALKGENDAVRISAIKELFDRGYGKAPQSHTLSGEDGGPIKYERIERVLIDPED